MSDYRDSKDHSIVPVTEPPPPKMPAPAVYGERTIDNYRPEQDLLDGRLMRSTIVQALTTGGIPVNDKAQMQLLLAAIQHQDSAALGIIRAKVESGAADSIAEMRQAAQAMLAAARETRNIPTVIDTTAREIPKLDAEALPEDEKRPFGEGELATGVSTETFESFQRRMGPVQLAEKEEEDD